jgi:antitoxin (DNA-binding transcriptional repressor) of toxin-antitoxin stability system
MKTLQDDVTLSGEIETITASDFRQRPGDVFARVELGKTFIIIKNSKPMAVISKLPGETLALQIAPNGHVSHVLVSSSSMKPRKLLDDMMPGMPGGYEGSDYKGVKRHSGNKPSTQFTSGGKIPPGAKPMKISGYNAPSENASITHGEEFADQVASSMWKFDPNDPTMAHNGAEKWDQQVYTAKSILASEIEKAIDRVTDALHDGQFFP